MKKKPYLCAVMLLALACLVFAGCGVAGKAKTPRDYITDAYGNNAYTISFSGQGLEAPIDDITYSAQNMPKLPTPEKVGYIFSGWFMDKECTIPYTDGILYLYMQNVVLYPKWIREEFVVNGTYDIEFSARILEDTVVVGEKTEQYGGYRNFAESIIETETCIEKSDGHKYLKIQYDAGYSTPFTASVLAMQVTVARQSASKVRIAEKIVALNDRINTIFINIDNIELSDTVYLNVSATNYGSNVPQYSYDDTTTTYTVAFNITKIIGFASAYEDSDVPLEEGWYLAKSYYANPDGSDSMGTSFNPVYSYIYSDGENYTLVKPNAPYDGLVTNYGVSDPTVKYYDRLMSFIPVQVYYFLERDDASVAPNTSAAYFPSANGASRWGNYAVEFHADTGKHYNIFYLGNSVKREMVVQMAVTGYMEVASGMGYITQLLTIDHEQIIKLSEVDYTPLSGNSYEYQTEVQFYPGASSDLSEKNLAYAAVTEYGLSTEMINFFYSAGGDGNTVYSSRIEFTPTAATNARTVADSRYIVAHFDVNAQVYGYDVTKGDLFADSMTVQTFGLTALRETVPKTIGKSFAAGDAVRLADVYAEKVNKNFDFDSVAYKLYRMNNGKADFTDEIFSNGPTFTFESDVAVLFTSQHEEGARTTLVELATYAEPIVKTDNSAEHPFDDPNATYGIGQTVHFPDVRYSWMGVEEYVISDYYRYLSDDSHEGAKPTQTAFFDVSERSYALHYAGRNVNSTSIVLSTNKTVILYELKNKYGERRFLEFTYTAADRAVYEISDSLGTVVAQGNVTYNEKDSSLRKSVSASLAEILRPETYGKQLERTLTFTIGQTSEEFALADYSVYTDSACLENVAAKGAASENAADVWNAVKNSKYALVVMRYRHQSDIVYCSYLYNVNFGGKDGYEIMDYDSYFSNYQYTYPVRTLYGSDGTPLGRTWVSFSQGANYTSQDYQQTVVFGAKGKYTIYVNVSLNDMSVFGGAKTGGRSVTLKQTIEVLDRYSDVYVTYKTDERHPFDDGTTERTVTYSLADDISMLTKTSFGSSQDILYGFVANPYNYASSAYKSGETVENYIKEFNAQSTTLYAVWDGGLTVTAQASGNADKTQFVWLNEKGVYVVKLSDFDNVISTPSGYKHVGWTGGFLGDDLFSGSMREIKDKDVEWDNADFFVVTAVFKKILNVGYRIDGAYSDDWQRGETVVEGGSVANPNLHMNVSCKVDGYEFKGWYVKDDEGKTIVDLATYVITEDTTFVALFGEIEDDEA